MKKLLLILPVVLSIFVFSACLGAASSEATLHYYLDDGSAVPNDIYSESNLTLTPDYELRTLAIKYSRAFPKKEGEGVDPPVDTEGVVAAAFFDSFEEVINILEKDPQLEGSEKKDGDLNFVVRMNNRKGENKFDLSTATGDDVEKLKALYYDIVELFSEDVY